MHWFKKCIFWKNSFSHFRGHWGQEVIFEVAKAKFWISSSFNKFWFRIFVVLDFKVVWPQQPPWPRKRPFLTFQKCNFWKHSPTPFRGRWGRRCQTTSKSKTMKILNENLLKLDEIQNLASATSKMTSWPQRPRNWLSEFFQKLHF